MLYKFLKDYRCTGCFTECIDDSCPSMGNYTKKITRTFQPEEVVDMVPISSKIVEFHCAEYGSSLHGTSTSLYIDVEHLKKEGVLYELSEEEIHQYYEIKYAQEQYNNTLLEVEKYHDYIQDDENEINDKTMEQYVKCIIKSIRAHAKLIIAQI